MAKVKHISVGADGTVWCADDLDRLFRRKGQTTSWERVEKGFAKVVAVRNANEVWCVNAEGQVHCWVNGGWKPQSPEDKKISDAKTISVAADGTVCYGNSEKTNYELFWRKKGTGGWVQVEGEFGGKKDTETRGKVAAVLNENELWCVNAEGQVWQLDDKGQLQQDKGAKDAQTISVDESGTVWYGNKGGQLLKREAGAWKEPYPAAKAVVVAVRKNEMWCVNADGQVHWWDSQGKHTQMEQSTEWKYTVKQPGRGEKSEVLGRILERELKIKYERALEIAPDVKITVPDSKDPNAKKPRDKDNIYPGDELAY